MTSGLLRITGPDAEPYTLGRPIWVYTGEDLLAKLDPVPLLRSGTELHIEAFEPTGSVRDEPRHVGRLIFLEICAFIIENFQQIQAISFVLSRQIDWLANGAALAATRSETMTRIGAVDVRIEPKSDAKPGHFVVSGVWIYSERTHAALMSVLEKERANYTAQPIGSRNNESGSVVARLKHLVSGRS
ncbi:MAG: hypothetical protein JSS14_27460 [Proteobacteria bacterium]|nr:hypothetical protein [Pseudomonadota bacterium]